MLKTPVKIRIKSLAAEAKQVKKEEHKKLERARYYRNLGSDNAKSGVSMSIHEYEQLRRHRKEVLAKEARTMLIAYGFLNGKDYAEIEQPYADKPVDLQNVTDIVYYCGDFEDTPRHVVEDNVYAWIDD